MGPTSLRTSLKESLLERLERPFFIMYNLGQKRDVSKTLLTSCQKYYVFAMRSAFAKTLKAFWHQEEAMMKRVCHRKDNTQGLTNEGRNSPREAFQQDPNISLPA